MDCSSAQTVENSIVGSPDEERNKEMMSVVPSVAIFWDIENCCVPRDVIPEEVAANVMSALRAHPQFNGSFTLFSAYGDFNNFPPRVIQGLQNSGVKLEHVPNRKKEAADKAIILQMLVFAFRNPPPFTIMLISGDGDFADAVRSLADLGYVTVVAVPNRGVGVSSKLRNGGRFVWDWPSLARGHGLVPANVPNEAHLMGTPSTSLLSQTRSSSSSTICVEPADIDELKEQIVQLVTMSGGSLFLSRLAALYWREFGGPLLVARYDCCNLVDLIERMWDDVYIVGRGHMRYVCLREHGGGEVCYCIRCCLERSEEYYIYPHEESSGYTFLDEGLYSGRGTPGDETLSNGGEGGTPGDETSNEEEEEEEEEEESNGHDELEEKRERERITVELQELLVSKGCEIPMPDLLIWYKQRYGKELDYSVYRTDQVEDFVSKVWGVTIVEHQGTKFLVPKSEF